MKKLIYIITLFLGCYIGTSQVPNGGDLLGLHSIAESDISSINNPIIGSIFYNSTRERIYVFRVVTGWTPLTNSTWDIDGNTIVNGSFIGSLNAQDVVIKSNNLERIRIKENIGQILINQATPYSNHSLIIKANGIDVLAFQNANGDTKWHWNLLGTGLNFSETGVLDYRLFLKHGGGVGIDTDNPTEKLDINGTLRIRDLSTTTSNLDVLVTTNTGVVQKRDFADFISATGVSTTTIKVDQSYIWAGQVNDPDIHRNNNPLTLQQTRADIGWGFANTNQVSYTGTPDYIKIDLMAVANNTGNHWAHPHIKIFRNGVEIGEGSGLHMDDSGSYSGRTTTVIAMIDANPGTNPVYTFRTYEDDNRTMNNPTLSQLSPVSLVAINKMDVVVTVTTN